MVKIHSYYNLTKPGIIMGNTITNIAGFALASKGDINLGLFAATVSGLSGIIASACVFNNYIDRDIDRKMERTKKRGLVTGTVSGSQALVFASLLGFVGLAILARYTNPLALGIAMAGFFIYVVLYGFWKRRSSLGTIIGAVSGAIPPVVGYTAVSSRLDGAALLLFLILVLWQMPHFFAIAIYRFKDYKAAGIPVLPVQKGVNTTRLTMVLYVGAFLIVAPLLSLFRYTGFVYGAAAVILSGPWLWLGLKGFRQQDEVAWARKMFRWSLVVITVLCIVISIDPILP